jgi:hypothetical protein
MIKFYDFNGYQYTRNILNKHNLHRNILTTNLCESNIFVYFFTKKFSFTITHLIHFFIVYIIKINNLLSFIINLIYNFLFFIILILNYFLIN